MSVVPNYGSPFVKHSSSGASFRLLVLTIPCASLTSTRRSTPMLEKKLTDLVGYHFYPSSRLHANASTSPPRASVHPVILPTLRGQPVPPATRRLTHPTRPTPRENITCKPPSLLLNPLISNEPLHRSGSSRSHRNYTRLIERCSLLPRLHLLLMKRAEQEDVARTRIS